MVIELNFPVKGAGRRWVLPPELLATLTERYPRLDVLDELVKALTWCEANPAKQKTVRGMERFLVAWLNRAKPTNVVRMSQRRVPGYAQPTTWNWIQDCEARHGGRCRTQMEHWNRTPNWIEDCEARHGGRCRTQMEHWNRTPGPV